MKLQKRVGKTYWPIMAASMPWSFPAMVAGWPLVEMTGKQDHHVHLHIFITNTVIVKHTDCIQFNDIGCTRNGDWPGPKQCPPRSLSLFSQES